MREKVRIAVQVAIPTLLILIAESVFFFARGNTGLNETTLLIHGLNVVVCVLLPVFTNLSPYLFQAFSLVSILRILNIGMPIFFTLTLYWFPFIYGAAILAAFLVVRRNTEVILPIREQISFLFRKYTSRRNESGRGWRLVYLPLGIVVGLVLANVEYWVLKTGALIPTFDATNLLALAIVMFVFVGFGEELIFRYILQARLQKTVGVLGGIFLAAALFTAMHSGYSSVTYLLFVLVVGLILGYSFYRTGSLGFVTIIHGSINFFLFSFIPFGYLTFF